MREVFAVEQCPRLGAVAGLCHPCDDRRKERWALIALGEEHGKRQGAERGEVDPGPGRIELLTNQSMGVSDHGGTFLLSHHLPCSGAKGDVLNEVTGGGHGFVTLDQRAYAADGIANSRNNGSSPTGDNRCGSCTQSVRNSSRRPLISCRCRC